MIEEAFISGFCRTFNQTSTVCCEYDVGEDGSWTLSFMDCAHETCLHHGACSIYAEAHSLEGIHETD